MRWLASPKRGKAGESASPLSHPQGPVYDSVFVLSSGRVTSIGPKGEFNWQVYVYIYTCNIGDVQLLLSDSGTAGGHESRLGLCISSHLQCGSPILDRRPDACAVPPRNIHSIGPAVRPAELCKES